MAPRTSLTILPTTPSNKPFKSSNLALPPSPFSPKYPITQPPKPTTSVSLTNSIIPQPIPARSNPPPQPLNWLWQCHLCHRTYRLATTRRCLDDGHYFCSGTTAVKRSKRHPGGKKVVRHKACQSEFDYQGWKVWGSWRRRVGEEAAAALTSLAEGRRGFVFGFEELAERKRAVDDLRPGDGPAPDGGGKDCWNGCDYPSECRWGRHYGVRTPSPPSVSVPSSPAASLDDNFLHLAQAADTLLDSTAITTTPSTGHEDETKKPSMDDLLASANRRKRRSTGAAPSPLTSNPASATPRMGEEAVSAMGEEGEQSTAQKAFDDLALELVRKSFGGSIVGALAGKGRRGSAPITSASSRGVEEKAGSSSAARHRRIR